MRTKDGVKKEYAKLPEGQIFMDWVVENQQTLLLEETCCKSCVKGYQMDTVNELLAWLFDEIMKNVMDMKRGHDCDVMELSKLVEAHNWLINAKEHKATHAMINVDSGLKWAFYADSFAFGHGIFSEPEFFIEPYQNLAVNG